MEEFSDLPKVSKNETLTVENEDQKNESENEEKMLAGNSNDDEEKFLAGNSNDDKEKFLAGNSNDEPDALPKDPHYRNLDLSMTIISILTYIFDLVRFFS